MFDEVQCGLGRTGEMMAADAWVSGIEPDAVSWAKGMGGGIPIGAFWASAKETPAGKLCDILSPGSHGSTYGGNPLSAATSLAVLKHIEEENWLGNVKKKSTFIQQEVDSWDLPVVKELKGIGFLLGFELDGDHLEVPEGQTPAGLVVNQLMQNGLLTVMAGTNIVRWLPALTANKEEVKEALAIMKDTLQTLSK